jgi:xanthine/uracil permease
MSATTKPAPPHTIALQAATAIIEEVGDLVGFLAAVGNDLPADVTVETAVLLDGVRQVLGGITARIGEVGPG